MFDVLLVAVAALGLVVASLSGRLRRLPVSEPLLALTVGVLVGPEVLGLLDLEPLPAGQPEVHEGTRVLLAVSVMAIALRYPMEVVRARVKPVLLLLAVAMPAMAALASLATGLALGVGIGTALLVGTAVTPTDPVLASSVVTGDPAERTLPGRVRQLLSLESGANDGLALPLVLIAVAVAGPETTTAALAESLWQVGGALAVGLAAGWLGGRALRAGDRHGSTEPVPHLFFTLVLALGLLGVSGVLRIDGILAVFAAGLAVNAAATGDERHGEVPVDEGINRFALLPLFVVLGAVIPWQAWADLGWAGPAVALGVLLLRRLPVLLALRRPLRLGWPEALFLGWFGPIGVSAVFYLTLEAERLALDPVVLAAGTLVVVASTVAHGMTSAPALRLYERVAGEPSRPRADDEASGRR